MKRRKSRLGRNGQARLEMCLDSGVTYSTVWEKQIRNEARVEINQDELINSKCRVCGVVKLKRILVGSLFFLCRECCCGAGSTADGGWWGSNGGEQQLRMRCRIGITLSGRETPTEVSGFLAGPKSGRGRQGGRSGSGMDTKHHSS